MTTHSKDIRERIGDILAVLTHKSDYSLKKKDLLMYEKATEEATQAIESLLVEARIDEHALAVHVLSGDYDEVNTSLLNSEDFKHGYFAAYMCLENHCHAQSKALIKEHKATLDKSKEEKK